MEQRRKARAKETGDPRENPSTSDIARGTISTYQNPAVTRPGIKPVSAHIVDARSVARAAARRRPAGARQHRGKLRRLLATPALRRDGRHGARQPCCRGEQAMTHTHTGWGISLQPRDVPPPPVLTPAVLRAPQVVALQGYLIYTVQRHDGNTARLARRSDEALEVRVSVARITFSLLDLGTVGGGGGDIPLLRLAPGFKAARAFGIVEKHDSEIRCIARRGDESVDAHVSVAPIAPTLSDLRRAKRLQPGHLKTPQSCPPSCDRLGTRFFFFIWHAPGNSAPINERSTTVCPNHVQFTHKGSDLTSRQKPVEKRDRLNYIHHAVMALAGHDQAPQRAALEAAQYKMAERKKRLGPEKFSLYRGQPIEMNICSGSNAVTGLAQAVPGPRVTRKGTKVARGRDTCGGDVIGRRATMGAIAATSRRSEDILLLPPRVPPLLQFYSIRTQEETTSRCFHFGCQALPADYLTNVASLSSVLEEYRGVTGQLRVGTRIDEKRPTLAELVYPSFRPTRRIREDIRTEQRRNKHNITAYYSVNCTLSGGRGGVAVGLLASHLGEPGSIPGGVTPKFSHVGIVTDDDAGRRVFPGDLPFLPSLHSENCFTPVGSQDLDVQSHPNLCTSYILRQLDRERPVPSPSFLVRLTFSISNELSLDETLLSGLREKCTKSSEIASYMPQMCLLNQSPKSQVSIVLERRHRMKLYGKEKAGYKSRGVREVPSETRRPLTSVRHVSKMQESSSIPLGVKLLMAVMGGQRANRLDTAAAKSLSEAFHLHWPHPKLRPDIQVQLKTFFLKVLRPSPSETKREVSPWSKMFVVQSRVHIKIIPMVVSSRTGSYAADFQFACRTHNVYAADDNTHSHCHTIFRLFCHSPRKILAYIQCFVVGAVDAEWLACSPPTKANRAQSPAGSPDFRKWESCQTMPLVGGSSRFPRPSIPAPPHSHLNHPHRLSRPRPNLFTHVWSAKIRENGAAYIRCALSCSPICVCELRCLQTAGSMQITALLRKQALRTSAVGDVKKNYVQGAKGDAGKRQHVPTGQNVLSRRLINQSFSKRDSTEISITAERKSVRRRREMYGGGGGLTSSPRWTEEEGGTLPLVGGVVVSLLASHLDEPGSIPNGVVPGFSHAGIVPDNAAGQRVFSRISPLPSLPAIIPALLRLPLIPALFTPESHSPEPTRHDTTKNATTTHFNVTA
ncbi:hypothetical protein PR048_026279 [Dryococelus australis]|uniref:Uncharacterized protein n=1 Tax=Dryococelus australis TaxID=614101 RepID=A0ABQ9GKX1_9NEOP|nr:hypothetical protein PR048_026279 [Dryococelus australis]